MGAQATTSALWDTTNNMIAINDKGRKSVAYIDFLSMSFHLIKQFGWFGSFDVQTSAAERGSRTCLPGTQLWRCMLCTVLVPLPIP